NPQNVGSLSWTNSMMPPVSTYAGRRDRSYEVGSPTDEPLAERGGRAQRVSARHFRLHILAEGGSKPRTTVTENGGRLISLVPISLKWRGASERRGCPRRPAAIHSYCALEY